MLSSPIPMIKVLGSIKDGFLEEVMKCFLGHSQFQMNNFVRADMHTGRCFDLRRHLNRFWKKVNCIFVCLSHFIKPVFGR